MRRKTCPWATCTATRCAGGVPGRPGTRPYPTLPPPLRRRRPLVPPCRQVHWFSIINSLIISAFLTGMVAMILVRALRADIARYNRVLTEEEKAEEREESGWK